MAVGVVGSLVRVELPFGDRTEYLDIEDRVWPDCQVVGLRPVVGARNVTAAIEASVRSPIGSQRLSSIARGYGEATIVVDDATRRTPAALIIPCVVEELTTAGVARESITVLVACGTHRPMTERELLDKLGASALRDLKVVQHACDDEPSLVHLGSTSSGVPIVVNRLVTGDRVVVGIGSIVPHRYCGWAGGAKIIQPGVSGSMTTSETHLGIRRDPRAQLGAVENSIRWEIEAVAEATGLRFVVNTILDSDGNLVDVVSGDFRLAFREGVRRAKAVYCVPIERLGDVVVVSGYPSDSNLWQAGKALYSAELAVKEGGCIVLVAACPEGMGEHGEFSSLLGLSNKQIEDELAAGRIGDRIAAAAALAVGEVRAKARVVLVTAGVTDEEAARAGMVQFRRANDALRGVQGKNGDLALTVLRDGVDALPRMGRAA